MISWIDQPILGDGADFTRQFIDPITQGAASLFPRVPPHYPCCACKQISVSCYTQFHPASPPQLLCLWSYKLLCLWPYNHNQ